MKVESGRTQIGRTPRHTARRPFALAWALAFLLAAWGTTEARAAGPRAGLGGFRWASATPQSNALNALAAPWPGRDGMGLIAVGDASTFLIRRSPLADVDGSWLCGRGRPVSVDLSLRGVGVWRDPFGLADRVAVAAGDGSVLVGDGCRLDAVRLTKGAPLNAAAWAGVGGQPRLAVLGNEGAAFYRDGDSGDFLPATISPAPPAPPDLLALHFPAPDASPVGYAAGRIVTSGAAFGVLLRTDDGGKSWTPLPGAPSAAVYRDVFFVNPEVGFALGTANGQGVLARTLDAGARWQVVGEGPASLRAVAAFDGGRAVLAGAGGLYLWRAGAGLAPIPQPVDGLDAPIPMNDVDTAGGEAWAVGERGVIFRSDDAGETWEAVAREDGLTAEDLQPMLAIRYLSEKDVLLAGGRGAILRSQNGGETFSPMVNPARADIYALGTPGARNAGTGTLSQSPGVAVGAGRTVLRFDPDADAWRVRSHLPTVNYRAAAMLDMGQAIQTWVVGDGGAIGVNTGGPLWTPMESGTTANLHAVHATRADHGPLVVAAGEGGTVLVSRDGVGWTPSKPLPAPFTQATVRGVFLRPDGFGLLVGDGGLVARTFDAGASWTPIPTDTSADLYGVSFVPPDLGEVVYAVGAHQTVLRSTDNGARWTALPGPVPGQPKPDFILRAVQALTPDHAFVAGDQGHLLEWTPNGEWVERGLGGANHYRALRMASGKSGIAVIQDKAGDPLVASTEDGWRTPRFAALPPNAPPLYGADLLDNRAVLAGAGGAALRSDDALGGAAFYRSASSAIRAVASPKPGEYIAAGEDALLLHSQDDGETWEPIDIPNNPYGPRVEYRAIALFPEGGAGYLAGKIRGQNTPVLLRTTDGGKSWEPAPAELGPDAAGIHALAVFSGMVLAGAENGAVYLHDGTKWNVHRPIEGFTGAWNAISASDTRWYVAGDQGRAARWPDAAEMPRWQALNTGTRHNLSGIGGPPTDIRAGWFGGGGGDSLRDDIRGASLDPAGVIFTDGGGIALFGDVNRDLEVNVLDARTVLNTGAGQALPNEDVVFFGDMHPPAPNEETLPGDGVLDLSDVIRVWRTAMGL